LWSDLRLRRSFLHRPFALPFAAETSRPGQTLCVVCDRTQDSLHDISNARPRLYTQKSPVARHTLVKKEQAIPHHIVTMDINSLLSPSDSPAGTPTPQPPPALPSPSMLHSPRKRNARQMPSRTPSGLSQQITSSPQPHAALQQVPSPGFAHIANGARAMHSAMNTPQPLASPHDARMTPPQPMFRQASTPGMDTLAGRYPSSLKMMVIRETEAAHLS
jgi:hypothetical protein